MAGIPHGHHGPHEQHGHPPHPHPHPHPPSFAPPYPPHAPAPTPRRRTHRLPRHPALGRHSDLRILRTAYRRQRRVATLTALGYFTLFLLLSAFAPGLMAHRVSGGLGLGLLLGLCQLPVMGAAIALYEYTARRNLDPIADRIREQAVQQADLEARRR